MDELKAKKKNVNFDTILIENLGQFGMYQVRTVLLLSIAVLFITLSATEYLFTAARIPTRCLISECETSSGVIEFQPDWLSNAIPDDGGSFDNCRRYANSSFTAVDLLDVCPAIAFDNQTVVECEEYVYQNTYTIVHTYDLACDDWRRSLVGTIRSIGVFCALPVAGFISDRWGRRTALAITAINTAVIGVLRYFADTYVGFIISQFAESAFGGGGFSCAYIIVNEICGPKYRRAGSALMSSCYALVQALFALIAWGVPDWRLLTLVIYIPQLLSITFFWIMPESIRWYLSKQRYDEAEKLIKNVARVNKKHISEQTLEALRENMEKERMKEELEKQDKLKEPWLIVLVFQQKPMLLRCIVAPLWWITLTFIYYGLTINSVNISGNTYVNFMSVSLVEIPGYILSYFVLSRVGRKPTLISAFWTCGACQFVYLFMPNNMYGLALTVYLVGKCASAVMAMTIYMYTMELYPTKYRHRLFAFSSMMGRIGAIIAPLTPAFGDQLPFILFGSFATVAGLLVFLMPETRGAKLPDTMEGAVNTGKKNSFD